MPDLGNFFALLWSVLLYFVLDITFQFESYLVRPMFSSVRVMSMTLDSWCCIRSMTGNFSFCMICTVQSIVLNCGRGCYDADCSMKLLYDCTECKKEFYSYYNNQIYLLYIWLFRFMFILRFCIVCHLPPTLPQHPTHPYPFD